MARMAQMINTEKAREIALAVVLAALEVLGVVEFVSGKMVIIRNGTEWQVATNFVISSVLPDGANAPCSTYNRTYQSLEEARGSVSEEQAMAILESVAQPSARWSAVYDMSGGDVHLALGRNYERVHIFELEMEATTTR